MLFALLCAVPGQGTDLLDSREFQFRELLRQLSTTARLMHTTAHPDDEDGGMLTLEARGKGADVLLLTLTRGEGGQNRMGGNLLDSLGVLRTLELLAADRYYGVEQRFTRVADFGFSKTPAETFEKWQGHGAALADMVRVIRTFRPEVLISRFRGTEQDGHGHHQASGILTYEAFHAAADPTRFPEQIKEGLPAWQVKKLYVGNLRSPNSSVPLGPDAYTLQLNTAAEDSLLGSSYAQFAMQGLKHQLSQGAGSWSIPPGPRFGYYKLVETVLPQRSEHEQDFFDGIDTTLPGLAAKLGDAENRFPELRRELLRMKKDVELAGAAASMADAAAPLLDGYEAAQALLARLAQPGVRLAPLEKTELRTALTSKREQFGRAAALALGLSLQATVQQPESIPGGFMAVRGGTFSVTLEVKSAPPALHRGRFDLEAPKGWQTTRVDAASWPWPAAHFLVTVASDAPYSRPCITRKGERQTVYTVANDACAVMPLPVPVLRAMLTYSFAGHQGRLEVPVEVNFAQEDGTSARRPLAVGPKFSVAASPATRIVRGNQPIPFVAEFSAVASLNAGSKFTFEALAPGGWMVKPVSEHVSPSPCPHAASTGVGKRVSCRFEIALPQQTPGGQYSASGAVEQDGLRYAEGYTLITRPDLGSAFYYAPANITVSTIDVRLPEGLKVGYAMGSGDEIPEILTQLGLNLKLVSDEELAAGDLAGYGTIVLGIRAYDTREAVRRWNRRLLDYVSAGGTLVVQYNSGTAEFNTGNFTPYPAELGRERVTDEDAPVALPAPDSSILHYPNRIVASDFQGWVQERGLYFMARWDPRFQPLLESHDPGEGPLSGGLLAAPYGKGLYLYTGYSFFRQLPAGVPGAVRLFVNLVSAGHDKLPVK